MNGSPMQWVVSHGWFKAIIILYNIALWFPGPLKYHQCKSGGETQTVHSEQTAWARFSGSQAGHTHTCTRTHRHKHAHTVSLTHSITHIYTHTHTYTHQGAMAEVSVPWLPGALDKMETVIVDLPSWILYNPNDSHPVMRQRWVWVWVGLGLGVCVCVWCGPGTIVAGVMQSMGCRRYVCVCVVLWLFPLGVKLFIYWYKFV